MLITLGVVGYLLVAVLVAAGIHAHQDWRWERSDKTRQCKDLDCWISRRRRDHYEYVGYKECDKRDHWSDYRPEWALMALLWPPLLVAGAAILITALLLVIGEFAFKNVLSYPYNKLRQGYTWIIREVTDPRTNVPQSTMIEKES